MYSRKPRRGRGLRNFFLLFVFAAIAVFAWYGYMRFIPNNQQIIPEYAFDNPIIVGGEEAELGAMIDNGEVKLPLSVIQNVLGEDKPIRYEEDSGSIVFTTANKVLHLKTNSLEGTINRQPYSLTIAAESADGTVYIPASPLSELYGLKVEHDEATGVVSVFAAGDTVQLAEVLGKDGTALRSEPTIRAPYYVRMAQGESVRVWRDEDGWLLVQRADGLIGYADKGKVRLTSIEQIPEQAKEQPFVAWKVLGSKINLTWEAVYNRRIDPAGIGPMPGVNVVSPTWFELADGQGTIKGKADPAYVDWARQRGMQVWALFSNSFEPELTTEALSSVETRFAMIQQLIGFAQVYKLQGINLDFENVHTKDKENFVQFVRELTPLLHEQGLVVSVDVTPKSNSEMWSLFLDRPALGGIVDYMMVMAYDEHWASSPKSGSVASLPWVETSLLRIMEEDGVPASKLILSMPLYTRIWTEKTGEDGKVEVSSKAVGMEAIRTLLAEKKLTPVLDKAAGQNYVEYTENGELKRIWIEDEVSMQARVALARKYDLAGVATWQRAFQTPSTWTTIDNELTKRP
jgi:spore germination protein YaaH